MKTEEIINLLEEKSGLSMSKGEFGFIAGTVHPTGEAQGRTSASKESGYIIWKKSPTTGDGQFQTSIPVVFQIDIVVSFLTMKQEEFTKFLESKGFMTITAE